MTQPRDKALSHQIPDRLQESVRVDIFLINNKDYHFIDRLPQQIPVIEWFEGLSADNLINTCAIIFAECRLPSSLMSDAGTNSISGKFKDFCRHLDIHHALSSSYDHHSIQQGR